MKFHEVIQVLQRARPEETRLEIIAWCFENSSLSWHGPPGGHVLISERTLQIHVESRYGRTLSSLKAGYVTSVRARRRLTRPRVRRDSKVIGTSFLRAFSSINYVTEEARGDWFAGAHAYFLAYERGLLKIPPAERSTLAKAWAVFDRASRRKAAATSIIDEDFSWRA